MTTTQASDSDTTPAPLSPAIMELIRKQEFEIFYPLALSVFNHNHNSNWLISLAFILAGFSVIALKVLLLLLAYFIGLEIIKSIITSLRRRLAKAALSLSYKLEPENISKARNDIECGLEEIREHLDNTKNDSFRLKLENSFLLDKVEELEKGRQALLEELGGSSDGSYTEFELWQQMSKVLDLLIHDRIRLLSLLDAAVSSGNTTGGTTTNETLLQQVVNLKERNDGLQTTITSLRLTNSELSVKNEQLEAKELADQQEVERLSRKSSEESVQIKQLQQEVRAAKEEAGAKNRAVMALKRKQTELEKERDELLFEMKRSDKYELLEAQIKQLSQHLQEQRRSNQELVTENEAVQKKSVLKNREIIALRRGLTALEKERDELLFEMKRSNKYELLEAQIIQLSQSLQEQESDNEDLIAENDELSTMIRIVKKQLYIHLKALERAEFYLGQEHNLSHDVLDHQSYVRDHQDDFDNDWNI